MRRTPSTKRTSAAGSAVTTIGAHLAASTSMSTTASGASRSSLPAGASVLRRPWLHRELHRSGHCLTSETVAPSDDLRISYRTGICSANSATWVTIPTVFPEAPSSEMTPATTSRDSASRVPKPSSRKRESSRVSPTAVSATCSARASAMARDTRKVSPPERVLMDRRFPAERLSITSKSLPSITSSYWPTVRSTSRRLAPITSAEKTSSNSHFLKWSARNSRLS